MRYPTPYSLSHTAVAAVIGCAVLSLALGAGNRAEAQAAGRVEVAGASNITRRLQSITPRFGPPGTVVTVASGLMPAITPVRVGMGATRVGFETLAELLTTPQGEFSVAVTVPEWASREQSHRFILFDFYFNPIAMSEAFFVTDANGVFRRTGRVVREGVPCVSLRDADGQVYALVGEPVGFAEGVRVTIEGRLAESAGCGGNVAIGVLRVQPSPER
jgi:hypothetical protein